jgi:hypothetical protein
VKIWNLLLPTSEGMKRHADVNTGSSPIEVMAVEVREAGEIK